MMTDKNRVVYLVAALLAFGSWWLVQISAEGPETDMEVAQHTADYYSIGYQKHQMDDTGALRSEVKAARMVHYADDGTVHLQEPVLSFFRPNSKPWVIKAESGIVLNKGKEVLLNGFVFASKAAMLGGRLVSIRTSDLRVLPESSYAETIQWAELSSPPDKTTGIGMQLNYADPIRITLLSNVQGKYEIH